MVGVFKQMLQLVQYGNRKLLKACVRYFSLFLKEHMFFDYFERNTLK